MEGVDILEIDKSDVFTVIKLVMVSQNVPKN